MKIPELIAELMKETTSWGQLHDQRDAVIELQDELENFLKLYYALSPEEEVQ